MFPPKLGTAVAAVVAALTALAALVLASAALATEPLQWSKDLLYSSNQPNGTSTYTLANDFKIGQPSLPNGAQFSTNQGLVFSIPYGFGAPVSNLPVSQLGANHTVGSLR